jgi:hypothetical protein
MRNAVGMLGLIDAEWLALPYGSTRLICAASDWRSS